MTLAASPQLSELLARYERCPSDLRDAIAGLDERRLHEVPDPGAGVGLWSIQQVVVHTSDADLNFTDRMRRIIALDEPVMMVWDEHKYADRLHYDAQSADDAVALVEVMHRQMARVLMKLPPEAFARIGKHSLLGPQTLAFVLETATTHVTHHVEFIRRKRKLMGV